MDRAVVAASWKLLCPSTSPPRLFLLSPLPTFSPKAPFILWNLINQEPFSELVNGAVATSGQGELDALCCPFLSVSYSLCLSGYKLVGDISLTSTGLKAVLQPLCPVLTQPEHRSQCLLLTHVIFSSCGGCLASAPLVVELKQFLTGGRF